MSLKTSSNGQVLYIYNAGATIDLYDAATYKFMKAIQLVGRHDHRDVRVPAGGAGGDAATASQHG